MTGGRAVALCALAGAMALACCGLYGHAHPKRVWRYPEYLVMSVQDKQLMTEDEKAIARETGVAHFEYEGKVYAMDDLPPQFYAWHE